MNQSFAISLIYTHYYTCYNNFGDSMNSIVKRLLSVLLLILSILYVFISFNILLLIILILLFLNSIIYALILYNKKCVVNAGIEWYLYKKENIMIAFGIILVVLNIYNVLSVRYLWLVLNIFILVVALINDKNAKNKIY